MKNIIFAIMSLTLLISCNRNDFSIKDTYSGTFTIHNYNSHSDKTDTIIFDFRLKLDDEKFIILDTDGKEGCTGNFKMLTNNRIVFESDECSCWCDCNPAIDCGGNVIMNEYQIISNKEDELSFEKDWTYETISGTEISIYYLYDLKKE